MKKYLLFAPAFILFSCSGEGSEDGMSGGDSTETTVIVPPFEGDFKNDTIFRIDPTKETIVETPNGSSIEIPANILVDEKGKPIKKEVEVSFDQYHSVTDILASGIPMTYDSAGVTGNFVSGGMFTIKARSEGKKVFVKEGENITVNLATDKPDAFSFYEMNEQTGDWTYEMAPQTPVRNPRFDPAARPIQPQKADKNAFVLDLNFDLSDYSELTAFKGIVWEYVGKDDSLDPRKNSSVSKTRWQEFDLEPTFEAAYEYWLTMKAGTNSFTTKVKAALQGEVFESAMASYKTKKKEIADRIDNIQKPFIQTVQIDGFTTYNWDYLCSMESPEKLIADFDFGSSNGDKEKSMVFIVYPDPDVVVTYKQDDWDKYFAIDKKDKAYVLAALPGNKLAVFKGDVSDCFGQESYTFKMKVLDEKLNGKADIDRIITDL